MGDQESLRISKGNISIRPQGPPGATDDLLPNGGVGYLNEQVLWLRHTAMTDSKWALRVPEVIFWDKKREVEKPTAQSHHYQVGQDWRRAGHRLLFEMCPISVPLGPSPGTVTATVDIVQDDLVQVRMTLANASEQSLSAVACHFCLTHRRAPLLGRNTSAVSARGWIDFGRYVSLEPYRHYYFDDIGRRFSVAKEKGNPEELPAIVQPILFSDTVCEGGSAFVSAIGSGSVCYLMSNVAWPCTDILVGFGTIHPGGTSTRDIYVGLGLGTKEEWLDRLLRRFAYTG